MEHNQQDNDQNLRQAAVFEDVSVLKRWLFGITGAALLGMLILLIHSTDSHQNKPILKERKVRSKETGVVKDTLNGHEWVDLGLPSGTKWATYNVGAARPEEFGDYYAWGETETKEEYIDINSLTHRKDFKWLVKNGIIDEDGELTKDHDAATLIWGEPWRLPTEEEFGELIDLCTWEFTVSNEVNGYLVTGPNDQTIFIVAAGFKQGGAPEYIGEYGDYWSSTVVKELIGASCSLGYGPTSYGRRRYARFVGRTLRPVTD